MHFYDINGEPRHFVEMKTKPGQLRPTRIADAKKAGWVPSVTTILNLLDKRALTDWKISEHLKVAYRVRPDIFPSADDYLSEVKRLTEIELDKAPSAGTDVHDSLEKFFLGEMPENHIDICDSVWALISERCGDIGWVPESRFVSPHGFGGMVDLSNHQWIIDYKTKQTAEKFKPGKMAYPDHSRQLAAYRNGLGRPKSRCANIFICIETGELDFHEHSEEELSKGWETFLDCLNIWKRENYNPEFKEAA